MKRKSLPTGRDFLFVEGYGNENPGAFQSPRPLRGATELCFSGENFNPRAPCGARLGDVLALTPAQIFQPTRPLRGATCNSSDKDKDNKFQPTRPLRGATFYGRRRFLVYDISTHAPLAGRDGLRCRCAPYVDTFQPTRPLRGATGYKDKCGHRDHISTHAPLAGRDFRRIDLCFDVIIFQPTRPLRGATCC